MSIKKEKRKCIYCGKEFNPYNKSEGKYCSSKCQHLHRSEETYRHYLSHPEEWSGVRNIRWLKKYILEEQEHKCAICGAEDKWLGKPLVFVLDHIDGHAANNERTNLRLICPNCDSQLDTYKSKNKVSDRTYYHSHHR